MKKIFLKINWEIFPVMISFPWYDEIDIKFTVVVSRVVPVEKLLDWYKTKNIKWSRLDTEVDQVAWILLKGIIFLH